MNFFKNAFEGKNHWALYLSLLVIAYIIAQIPSVIFFIIYIVINIQEFAGMLNNASDMSAFSRNINDVVLSTLPGFAILMSSFVALFLVMFFMFKLFHKRDKMTLISGEKKFRKRYFISAVIFSGLILIVMSLIQFLFIPDEVIVNKDITHVVMLFLLSIIFLPFQTITEELVFRSYLMQGFALCTKNKFISLIITSLLFALLHSANPEIESYGFFNAMPIYLLVGLSLGFFAILSDGIEFSYGFHFINNFIGLVFLGNSNGLNFGPLFSFNQTSMSFFDYLSPILFTIILYLIFRRKFKWNIKEAFDNTELKNR